MLVVSMIKFHFKLFSKLIVKVEEFRKRNTRDGRFPNFCMALSTNYVTLDLRKFGTFTELSFIQILLRGDKKSKILHHVIYGQTLKHFKLD